MISLTKESGVIWEVDIEVKRGLIIMIICERTKMKLKGTKADAFIMKKMMNIVCSIV